MQLHKEFDLIVVHVVRQCTVNGVGHIHTTVSYGCRASVSGISIRNKNSIVLLRSPCFRLIQKIQGGRARYGQSYVFNRPLLLTVSGNLQTTFVTNKQQGQFFFEIAFDSYASRFHEIFLYFQSLTEFKITEFVRKIVGYEKLIASF